MAGTERLRYSIQGLKLERFMGWTVRESDAPNLSSIAKLMSTRMEWGLAKTECPQVLCGSARARTNTPMSSWTAAHVSLRQGKPSGYVRSKHQRSTMPRDLLPCCRLRTPSSVLKLINNKGSLLVVRVVYLVQVIAAMVLDSDNRPQLPLSSRSPWPPICIGKMQAQSNINPILRRNPTTSTTKNRISDGHFPLLPPCLFTLYRTFSRTRAERGGSIGPDGLHHLIPTRAILLHEFADPFPGLSPLLNDYSRV